MSVEADESVSSTVEASEREIWIAPDGSGRIIEKRGDRIGRSGVGFEIDSDADHDVRSRLIFEPVKSDLLEAQQGSITGGYGDSGWTAYTLGELVEDVPKGGTPTMLRTNE